MDLIEQLMQDSAELYQLLTNVPKGEERDKFVLEVNKLLDNRGEIINKLQKDNIQLSLNVKSHVTLIELDKGIRHRLKQVMDIIKVDMKNFNQSKKSEQHYINPYSNVSVMDGKYYDRKK